MSKGLIDRASFFAGLRAFAIGDPGPHPTGDELCDYFEQKLEPTSEQGLRVHLARCLPCSELAAALEATYQESDYWGALTARGSRVQKVVSFVVAELRKLAPRSAEPAALRAHGKGPPSRRLEIHTFDRVTVVLWLDGSDNLFARVERAGEPVAGARVRLERLSLEGTTPAVECASGTTDSRGEVNLESLGNLSQPAPGECYRAEVDVE